jgi:hypothetical protein
MSSETTQIQMINMPSFKLSFIKEKIQQGIIRNAKTRSITIAFIKRLMGCFEIIQANGSPLSEICFLPEIKCYLRSVK